MSRPYSPLENQHLYTLRYVYIYKKIIDFRFRKMTLAKMDQRFQLINHHRDDKQAEAQRALNPVINNSTKPNKVSSKRNYQTSLSNILFPLYVRLFVVNI